MFHSTDEQTHKKSPLYYLRVWAEFYKNGPIPASFCLFSFFSHYNFNNTNWKKHRWCAWDSNPRPIDGRCRRYHGAMAAAPWSEIFIPCFSTFSFTTWACFARSLCFVQDNINGIWPTVKYDFQDVWRLPNDAPANGKRHLDSLSEDDENFKWPGIPDTITKEHSLTLEG